MAAHSDDVRTYVMSPQLIGPLGGMEVFLIFAVILLLFGAAKLPELARGTGRALRIFKAETKGLMDDDTTTDEQREIEARNQAERDRVERDRLDRDQARREHRES